MPTFHKLDKTPTTFPHFTSLPPELQLLIWEHAIVRPWQVSEAWQTHWEEHGLLRIFGQYAGPSCMNGRPCCTSCTPWRPTHNIVGRNGPVAHFWRTSYEEGRYMMWDALSVSRTTRHFVLKWWKRTIDEEEAKGDDLDKKKEIVTVLVELIEKTESQMNE